MLFKDTLVLECVQFSARSHVEDIGLEWVGCDGYVNNKVKSRLIKALGTELVVQNDIDPIGEMEIGGYALSALFDPIKRTFSIIDHVTGNPKCLDWIIPLLADYFETQTSFSCSGREHAGMFASLGLTREIFASPQTLISYI
jgi:hypothetical protein